MPVTNINTIFYIQKTPDKSLQTSDWDKNHDYLEACLHKHCHFPPSPYWWTKFWESKQRPRWNACPAILLPSGSNPNYQCVATSRPGFPFLEWVSCKLKTSNDQLYSNNKYNWKYNWKYILVKDRPYPVFWTGTMGNHRKSRETMGKYGKLW